MFAALYARDLVNVEGARQHAENNIAEGHGRRKEDKAYQAYKQQFYESILKTIDIQHNVPLCYTTKIHSFYVKK